MDVNEKINELIGLVESARAMPMSASCVVNRAQMLEMLEDLRQTLPEQLERAQQLLVDREALLEEGRREAGRIVASARDERGAIISSTDVSREAATEAERIREQALREADQIRAEADDYVDQKLANFEVVLTKTLSAVGRGREKMRPAHSPMEELGRHVEEQDAADAEREYNKFGEDLTESEPVYGDTAEYHRIAEEPYVPHEPQHYGQDDRQYAARSYGADDGYREESSRLGEGQGFGDGSGAYPREYGEPEPVSVSVPHQQQVGQHSGSYQMREYGSDAYGQVADPYATGEYTSTQYGAASQYGATDYSVPQQSRIPTDYPADQTSYFDTSLIDVRQFRDTYGN